MLIFGVLLLFGSAGCGVMLALENRDVVVRAEVAGAAWTGHLYTAVIVGALLACWFMLGAAFVVCRLAETRRRAVSRSAALTRGDAPPLGHVVSDRDVTAAR
jgi:hypothetical protein